MFKRYEQSKVLSIEVEKKLRYDGKIMENQKNSGRHF